MPELLDDAALDKALKDLPGWRLSEDKRALERSFQFSSFGAAFAFMTRSALYAEKINHHPDWSNVFDRVEVRLLTHAKGGITESDTKMAARMNSFARAQGEA